MTLVKGQRSSESLAATLGRPAAEIDAQLSALAEPGFVVKRGPVDADDRPVWLLQPMLRQIVPMLAFAVRAEIALNDKAQERIHPEHAEAVSRLCLELLLPERGLTKQSGRIAMLCLFPKQGAQHFAHFAEVDSFTAAGTVAVVDELGEILTLQPYRGSSANYDGAVVGTVDMCLRFLSECDPAALESRGRRAQEAVEIAREIASIFLMLEREHSNPFAARGHLSP